VLLTDAQAVGRQGFHGCGIGHGANCCAFLVVSAKGFECARLSELDTEIRRRVHAGLFNARRMPERPFPACQAEGWD